MDNVGADRGIYLQENHLTGIHRMYAGMTDFKQVCDFFFLFELIVGLVDNKISPVILGHIEGFDGALYLFGQCVGSWVE